MGKQLVGLVERLQTGSPTRKAVLQALSNRADDATWETWCSIADIAVVTEYTRRAINTHTAEMEARGWLEREARQRASAKGQTSNVYRLNLEQIFTDCGDSELAAWARANKPSEEWVQQVRRERMTPNRRGKRKDEGGASGARGPVQDVHGGGAQGARGPVQDMHGQEEPTVEPSGNPQQEPSREPKTPHPPLQGGAPDQPTGEGESQPKEPQPPTAEHPVADWLHWHVYELRVSKLGDRHYDPWRERKGREQCARVLERCKGTDAERLEEAKRRLANLASWNAYEPDFWHITAGDLLGKWEKLIDPPAGRRPKRLDHVPQSRTGEAVNRLRGLRRA